MRDSAVIKDLYNQRGISSGNDYQQKMMHRSGVNLNLKGSATGSNLASGIPYANVRNSRYGATTSLWNGSEQNGEGDNGIVFYEQSEGEDFLIGSQYSKKISQN